MGIDILLQYEFPLDLLKRNFQLLLGLDENPENITITKDIYQPGITGLEMDSCYLFAISTAIKGEVRQLLELNFHENTNIDMEDLAIQLCKTLHCFCLISDQNVNPYSMFKIDAKGEKHAVLLEGDALDDRDEYIIMSATNID